MARYDGLVARAHIGRVAPIQATTEALSALAVDHESRIDGCLTPVTATRSLWMFDEDADPGAQSGVTLPDSGTGAWIEVGGSGAASDYKTSVVAATTTTLAAYTRTANVILADANGAIGAVDGVTLEAGDRLLLKNGAAGADNGIYRVSSAGDGSTPFELERAADFDSSAKVSAGALVFVSEGTVNGDEFFFLSTNDAITLNTTSLTFTKLPNQADLAATTAGNGAALIGIQDAASQITATTVEGALTEIVDTAQALVVDLASTDPAKGSALIGYDGGTTVKAALDTILSTGLAVLSKTVGHADLTDSDAQMVIDFDSALPAGAMVVGYGANVTAVFDDVGDAAAVTFDLGISGGNTDVWVDGGSLNATGKVSTPTGTGESLVGAVTPSIIFDADVNLDTLTKGAATFYIVYTEPF